MSVLTIRKINKTYGNEAVLHDINIDMEEGEFLILVGPSGCGKTTLLNMIAGLESVTDGEIAIDDRRINDLGPRDRNIAMVFQSYALYPNMTVRGNISFGLEMRKVPRARRNEIVNNVAKTLQIEHLLDRKPADLSGGQRQRVAIGRALAREPALFLFDEPLSALDAKLRDEMRTELKILHQRLKTSMVYVTHDQIEAMTLGDRIAVMYGGRVQQLGTPQDIYDNPINRFVAGFIGSPAMNFIPCELGEENGGFGVRLSGGEQTKLLPLPEAIADKLKSWGRQKAVLGVRPEHVTPSSADHDAEAVSCPVNVVEPTGPNTYVFSKVNDVEIIVRCTPGHAPEAGGRAKLEFDLSKALFFDPETDDRVA